MTQLIRFLRVGATILAVAALPCAFLTLSYSRVVDGHDLRRHLSRRLEKFSATRMTNGPHAPVLLLEWPPGQAIISS